MNEGAITRRTTTAAKVTMQSATGGEPSPVNVPWSFNAAQ